MNKIFEFRNLRKTLDNYGPEISCLVSLASIIATGVSAFYASKKVAETKADYEADVQKENDNYNETIRNYWRVKSGNLEEVEVTDEIIADFEAHCPNSVAAHRKALRRRKIDYVLECLLDEKWTILSGGVAIGAEVSAMKLTGEKIAVLGGALGLSQDKIKKVLKKTKEAIGEEEFEKIKADIRADDIKEKMESGEPEKSKAPWDENGGEYELYYDDFTGGLYQFQNSQLQDAIASGREYFSRHKKRGGMDFNKWRSMLGLPDCISGQMFSFDEEHPFEVKITVTKQDNGSWVSAIEYPTIPDELKA